MRKPVNPSSNHVYYTMPALVAGIALTSIATPAWAAVTPGTLGAMTNNAYNSILSLQAFFSFLSYVLGVFFTVTGLQKMRDHVVDPDRNPLGKVAMRLGAAAFFIFLPSLADILVQSIGGGTVGTSTSLINYTNAGGITPNQSGDGLEGALTRFVANFAAPFLENLLPYFSYTAGVAFMLIGLKRLALANGDGAQAPGGMGTIGTFFIAATLMSLGYLMSVLNFSIFGVNDVYSNPLLKTSGSINAAMEERMNQLLWGVFIFLRVVGYISVVRGLFMLRGAAEGQNVTIMQVSTHLIAGAMLANGTGFVDFVQTTLISDPNNYLLKPL